MTASHTPVLELFAQWQTLREYASRAYLTDAQSEAADDEVFAIESTLLSAPSTCAADFAAKVLAYTHFGAFALNDATAPELWAEARSLTGTATKETTQ